MTPGAALPGAPRGRLTNLAHLDWLRETVTPPCQSGHDSYRLTREPTIGAVWTYAAASAGGYRRTGGGRHDACRNRYGQGAFNADDMARAAVVYLRHWRATGARESRRAAYQLLRGVAYLQTLTGPNAGRVVLWMQPDGTLQPSADPPEQPDPSDAGPACWLARAIWAFGEGYAAFRPADPAFARFLAARLRLALRAVRRDSLVRYGSWLETAGGRTPAWLIAEGADATGEALLGLAAYLESSGDPAVAVTLGHLALGVAAMRTGDPWSSPFGAVLPWARSRSVWHAWGGLAPAGLARAYAVLTRVCGPGWRRLADAVLAEAALADAASFTPYLLATTGPDSSWSPGGDRVQIAYGAQSRVESLLTVATCLCRPALVPLAGIAAAWFFGNNPARTAVYAPATGRTCDGIDAPGVVNHDAGAESTVHGLLATLALDANPEVAAVAATAHQTRARPAACHEPGRPEETVAALVLGRPGTTHGTVLARNLTRDDRCVLLPVPGTGPALVTAADPTGRTVEQRIAADAPVPAWVPAGGFVVVRR